MRALVLEHQNDENTYHIDDQYMFGNSLLIAPVTTKGAQTRVVYLPEGQWFDYWSGQFYQGKEYYNVVTPLDQLPIFVKAGAIIPMQEVIQYDDRKNWGKLTFEIFPGDDSEFKLYEDDGINKSYEDGNYSITTVSNHITATSRIVKIGKAEGKYPVPVRNYILKVHQEKSPSGVVLQSNGKKKKINSINSSGFSEAGNPVWYYDTEQKLLWVKSKKAAGEILEVQVAY